MDENGDQTNGLVITYLYQVIQSVTFPSPNGDRITGLVIITYLYQVIQSVTFPSTIVGGHQQPLKRVMSSPSQKGHFKSPGKWGALGLQPTDPNLLETSNGTSN